MADLEAELARFEAELASVEKSHSQTAPTSVHPSASYAAPQPNTHTLMTAQYAQPHPMSNAGLYGQYPLHSAIPMQHMPQPQHQMYNVSSYQAPAAVYSAPAQMSSEPDMQQHVAHAAQAIESEPKREDYTKDKLKKKVPGVLRSAAGTRWWDPTLAEWPENDYRIFVGDLGNEVNDDVLGKPFQKYQSFAKAKVVRDHRTNKTKGFGFISFLDANDFAKALKEMQGKYIGNRPCKLRKSSWQERNAYKGNKRKNNDKNANAAKKPSKGVLHK